MSIRVSVVVPTYKRNDLLRRCLAALLAQDFDRCAYEIIVVDDAASNETRQLVEQMGGADKANVGMIGQVSIGTLGPVSLPAMTAFTDVAPSHVETRPTSRSRHTRRSALPTLRSTPMVRYMPVLSRGGPAAARNLGWRAAQGEIIAFTDDDCVPSPGWLKAGVAAFADGVAGVYGKLSMPLPPDPTDYERNAAYLEHSEFVTANCLYRRDVLAASGGFDERFTAAWREDSDLFFALLEQGCRLEYAPDAVVLHPVRPAPWGISLSQQRKNRFNALLYKKHPALYRQRVQASPPWRYYGIIATLLVALAGAWAGQGAVVLGALGVWALLTALFCAQRLQHTSHAPHHIVEMIVTSILIPPIAIFWRLAGAIKFRVRFL
jgi:cellulose synthase/poly-beta-1,6-N-acetylglucosamine synthase-like glycosyltransferase